MRSGISRVQVEIIVLAVVICLAVVYFSLLPAIVGPKGAELVPPTVWKTAEPDPEKLVKEFKEKYPATFIEIYTIGKDVKIYATMYSKFTDFDLKLAEKLAKDNGYTLTWEVYPMDKEKIVVVFYFISPRG
jgi:hypothetical protein